MHRTALTAHTNHANPFFERQLNAMTQNFIAMGASASEASHRALAQLSAQVICKRTCSGSSTHSGARAAGDVPDTFAVHHAPAQPGRSESLSRSTLTGAVILALVSCR